MPEVKKALLLVREGYPYTSGGNDYVIKESNSIADIIRHAVSCSDVEEVRGILDGLEDA